MFEITCPNCGVKVGVTVPQFKGEEPIDCKACSWQHTKDWSRFHPDAETIGDAGETMPAVDETIGSEDETVALEEGEV